MADVDGPVRNLFALHDGLYGLAKRTITGSPDEDLISTSYVERHNLSLCMSVKRFARLSNAFSKKVENHWCAVSLYTT